MITMKLFLALGVAATISLPAMSQDPNAFKIGGGGGAKNGSVYSAVLGDFAVVCNNDDLTMEETNTSGGPANLQLLLDNQINAAIVPYSLLWNMKNENATRVANIKTIVALHSEPVHLIARSDTKVEGGVSAFGKNIGGDKITFDTAETLKGRQVGAVGGSVTDALILGNKLKIGWEPKSYSSTTELLAALGKKEVDAIVIVAGQGSPAVKAIKGQYKLLPIRGNSDTAEIYTPTKVQYDNMNNGQAVDTVSTQALLVTRRYSGTMLTKLGKLRQCFYDNLEKIQNKTGTNPVWQDIDAANKGKWPLYELPNAAPTPAEAKPAAAPADAKPAASARAKRP